MLFKSSSAAAKQPSDVSTSCKHPFFFFRTGAVDSAVPQKGKSKRGGAKNVQEPPGERGAAGRWPAPRGAAAEGGRELRGRPQASRIFHDHRDHGRRRAAKNDRRPGRAELSEHPQLALREGIFTQNATNASKWRTHAAHGALISILLLLFFFLHACCPDQSGYLLLVNTVQFPTT